MEEFAELREYERKHSTLSWIPGVVTPIHEDILLTGMSMKITVKD